MKKKRFIDDQTIGFVKQAPSGVPAEEAPGR